MKFNKFNAGLCNSLFIAALVCGSILANSFSANAQATGKIVFLDFVDNPPGNEIFIIDPDGMNRTRISFNTTSEQAGADFSRDGRLVVFEFFSNIYIMNSNGTGIRQITFGNNGRHPAISADGTMVAFDRDVAGSGDEIFVVNADGTNLRRLTNSPGTDSFPSFSPDGSRLVFQSHRNGPLFLANLYLINLDGTNETRLTDFFEFSGRFSPDGTRITYMGRVPPGDQFHEIFVMNADGTNRVRLTDNLVPDNSPIFSLDGTLIAFSRSVFTPNGNRDHIFVMNPNGTNVRQITFPSETNLRDNAVPKWVPSTLLATRHEPFDFDGEGRADLSVFRPSEGNWYSINSFNNSFLTVKWGLGTDKLVPADYNGDARTDLAVYRDGTWYILESFSNLVRTVQFGVSTDLPRPGDFDGDGKADIGVFRPSNGTWYFLRSSTGQFGGIQFGAAGDIPMLGDYDGDGKTDFAVFRPSNGVWYIFRSSDNQAKADPFGLNGDIPLNGDFNGDGRSDLAVFRPSDRTWYVAKPTGVPAQNFDATQFGLATDTPVPADYDGDGKTDIAIYRDGSWWISRSTGGLAVTQFGVSSDKPVEASYLP